MTITRLVQIAGGLSLLVLAGCPSPKSPIGGGDHDLASVLSEERCDPNQMNRAAPLIVDWRGDDRLNLEATMRQGVAVVSYTCDAIKLLPHCRVKGDYGFIGVSTKEEKMSLKDQSEIIANLPLTGSALIARAGGELKQGAGIDVQLVMVGKKRTAISEVIKENLEGECDGATHFVQGATVGAFVVSTDSHALGKVMAEVFGGGGSAAGSSEKASQVVDGRPDHCEKADPMSEAPPSQCQSAMRLDLVKIAGMGDAPKANDGPADGTTHGKDNASCPPGLVFSGGKCTKKASVTADYQCSGKDEGECAAQCQKGNMASCRLQGLLQEDSGKFREALKSYLLACKGGDAISCSNAGYMYRTGRGVDQQDDTAAQLMQIGCEAGDARGCTDLGYYYEKGIGVPGSDERAAQLYKRGCDGGNLTGCANYAYMLNTGTGVAKDHAQAAVYRQRACLAGNARSCSDLGYQYDRGEGVPKDVKRAEGLYIKACDGDNGIGCMNAGITLEDGGKDLARAATYYAKGCKLEAYTACRLLGGMYQTGRGVAQDNVQAKAMFKQACDGGDPDGCKLMDTVGSAAKAVVVPFKAGTRVRATRSYDSKIRAGMTGTYYGTNGGNPPAFVVWDKQIGANPVYYTAEGAPPGKNAYAYWVEWNVIEEVLRPGTRVVATGNYDGKIKKGMEGVYWGTNGGSPPAFVVWDNTIGANPTYYTGDGAPPGKEKNAYWVPWNIIDLALPNGVRVIATKAYDGKIKRGMMGTYYGTNGKSPPAFVIWDDQIGSSPFYYTGGGAPPGRESYAYWVEWDVIKRAFQPGRKVRAVRDYDSKIKKGMTGVYWGTNGGNPPAFILWDNTIGADPVYYTAEGAPPGKNKNAYWVPWNVVEPLNY